MIPIKEGAVTRLVPESTRVVDVINEHGRGLVYRRKPSVRRDPAIDKPLTLQEARNSRRLASYAERLNGTKPNVIQLWEV